MTGVVWLTRPAQQSQVLTPYALGPTAELGTNGVMSCYDANDLCSPCRPCLMSHDCLLPFTSPRRHPRRAPGHQAAVGGGPGAQPHSRLPTVRTGGGAGAGGGAWAGVSLLPGVWTRYSFPHNWVRFWV